MPITRFKDEKEREEYLKKIREEQQSNLNKYFKQTGLENAYSGNYTNSHDGFNTAGMNDFAVKPSVWEQVKTTASNMLGNVGYGIGNGLIGFTQNEMRNQTSFKTLKSLGDTMLNNTLLGLPKGLGNLGKSIDATLKKNENYQNAKNILNTTIENNKNAIINPINEKLQKQEDINNERIRQNTIETTNPIGRKLVELAPSIGQMLPSAIPGAGTLYSVGSATDSYYDEAKARGMNEEQASTYSQLMGVVEGLTEQIGVGRFVKGGKVAKSSMSKAFRELGIGMTDNFIQEGIIEPISELTTKVTAGDEFLKHDYRTIEGWKELGSDMLNSAIDGALVGGIVGSASLGIGKASNLVDKMKKGYIPTSSDVRETFNEARKNGVDVDGIIQEELKSRISQPTENTRQNKNQVVTSQQDIANKINEIVKNDKYLSPEDKQSMIYATNDLASKNQLDNNNTLDAINQIKQMSQLSQENSDKLDIGKKYLSGRKEIYNKYRNITNYDNVIVEQAKEVIAPNKQGKRTKDQWLDVAKYIGTNIANRPNSEIQRIAYKSWQEETPNNTGTLNRQGQKYVKFMPDDWIDTIYDSVEKQRQKSGYVAKNDTINALDNLYKEYMNNQTAQNNIDTSSMNLIDSAKAYNLNGNDETIQSINQKLHDRGITSRFDENLFKDSNGKVRTDVNALWRNTIDEKGNTQREVIFNPRADTNKTLQQVYIHEMLHDMTGTKEFEDLSKLILDKNSNREGYSEARSNLEEMYSQVYDKNSKEFKSLINEEEIADTLAQKLGDQEFINSLNKEKPNVFKRIYNWVVDKLNKFTGSKNEKIYWEDVKNKFESAYRQEYQGNNNNIQSKLSFTGRNSNNTNTVHLEREKDKIVENASNKLYNNRRGGVNGKQENQQNDRRRVQGLLEIYEKGQRDENTDYEKLYGIKANEQVTEKEVKESIIKYANKYQKKNLSADERQLKDIINNLNGNVVFYEYGKENYFQGLSDKNTFYIDTKGNENTKNIFYHEIVHFLRQNNNEIYVKEIQPIVDKIAYDFDYQEAIFNYAKSSGDLFNVNDLNGSKQKILAEEVIADQVASIYGDLKADYGVPKNLIDDIKKSMNKILNRTSNGVTNTRQSIEQPGAWQSFLENQIGPTGKGKTVQELRLPTKENWDIVKSQNIINQNNKERLKDIGITENNDLITNNNDEDVGEEKIAQILEEMPSKEKEKSRVLAIFKANVFDKGIVFEELSRKTKNRELQGKWDYTLTASARGQNAIGMPRYEFDSKTKTQKLISKSLESIREEVGSNATEFNKYMYHQLNIDRMTLEERFGGDTGLNYERKNPVKNKPVFLNEITAEISKKIVDKYEEKNPKFKEWAKDVYDFLDANTQELVKSGVISEDTRQLFKEMYPHYVPISRVNNKGNAIAVPLDTRKTGVNSPIKRAKGGNQDILPLFETMANRTLQTYSSSARNNFGVELLHTLKTVQTAENIDVYNVVEELTNSDNNELLKDGNKTTPPTFTVFENGEKVTFEISKDMYDALKPVSEGLAVKIKALNKISNFRRGVLTEYNPVFMITNSLKDIQDVVVNSQHTAKTISKLPEAYSQIIDKGYWYNEYIQNGGEQNSYFNANDGSFENDKKVSIGKNVATMPLRAISKVNNIIEMSPRLAEYIASREKGRSIETSMLDASRVTTNFKAGGNVTKFLNRNGATFLNASVQGAMQQVRNIQEAKIKGIKGWTALACKYAIAGLPVILLNNILWKDDKDYQELQDYVKDNYYCIAKYGDGKFIRIPKGRTTATIQKIVSNTSEYLTEDKQINIDNLSKDFWEDLQFTMDNLAPNNPLDNNIISPIIQAVTNTSWYGEDIVPSRLQNKPVVEQYDESTDKLSKWLGEKLNVSPYKINYLLDQYGGGISDVVLPMLTPQAENNIIEDKFTTDSVMKSKYPGEFFEKNEKLNILANSDKASDLDKIKNKYMENISGEMNKLYQQKRKIENSDLEDETKKEQLKVVQKEINDLAKKGVEEVEFAKVKGLTAEAGEEKYYKYHGEWTKLDDDEKEKTQNMSLESYADFKNKIYDETQRQKDSGELEEDKQLKNTTKSKILLDSKYSDKDKLELYKNYISSTDKKVSVAVEKLGMPINVYLDYKSNKFENDKDEDGETISGTKRDKVYNYVNNLKDVDLIYKSLIIKMSDINDPYADKAIVDNVNKNKDINSEERIDILKTLGFKVDKYGNVENLIFIPIRSRIK
nr:MAG TPA: Large polyvalent protein associated domain 38 [Caudoviricetes sp.]